MQGQRDGDRQAAHSAWGGDGSFVWEDTNLGGQRAAKERGKKFSKRVAREECEQVAMAYEAPDDCSRTPWMHLFVSPAMKRKARQLSGEDVQGFVRAVSPPFFCAGVLSNEIKWVGCTDDTYQISSFVEVLELYGEDVPFLEWATHWAYKMTPWYPEEMAEMRSHLKHVPVRPLPPPPSLSH